MLPGAEGREYSCTVAGLGRKGNGTPRWAAGGTVLDEAGRGSPSGTRSPGKRVRTTEVRSRPNGVWAQRGFVSAQRVLHANRPKLKRKTLRRVAEHPRGHESVILSYRFRVDSLD